MLHGRAAELERLDGLIEDARNGRSGVLVVRGEPGVGKSALLAQAAERADGMRVLHAVGVESEAELPFAALHQLLRPVLDAAEQLPPQQASALRVSLGLEPGEADRFAISLAVLGLLAEVAEHGPLLCLVDDAHWLDQPSAAALVFAARRLEAERIALLLATRTGEGENVESAGFEVLDVHGLGAEDAAELLRERASTPLAPSVRDRLVEGTAGSPLALIALATTLSPDQIAGRESLPPQLPLDAELERSFLTRLGQLPEETRRVVMIAAADVSGDLAPVQVAASLLGLDVAALEPAEGARVVRIVGARVEFWHPLVRSAVYNQALFGERQAVHAALAEAYPEGDDRRAWHGAAAAIGPDDDVAAALEESADRATLRGGFGAASAALERAAELSSQEPERARRLQVAADAAWRAGEADRARSLLDAAAVLEGASAAQIAQLRGRIEVHCGVPSDGLSMLIEAGRALAREDPAAALELLADAGVASVYSGALAGVVEVGELAEEITRSSGEGDPIVVGFLVGHAQTMAGNPDVGGPLLREAIAAARDADDPEKLMLGALAALALGDDDLTPRELHLKAVERARERAMLGSLPTALVRLAYSELQLSRYRSARIHANEALRLARETGQEEGWPLCVLGLIAAIQGREDDCRTAAGYLLERAIERQIGNFEAFGEWTLGLFELGRGRPDEALARFEPIVAAGPNSPQPLTAISMAPDAVEAAVRAGQNELARTLFAPFELWAEHAASPWALAAVSQGRGLLSSGGEAEEHFREALEHHERARRPFQLARTELWLGETLRRGRKRKEARDHLRSAGEIFERLGADPWEERARNELRATGETARKRDPSTLGDLTPQELHIARLVASGARNREIAAQLFLSPRTIDYHLRKVFSKLGISSRGELVQIELGGDEEMAEAPAHAGASA